MSIATAFSGVVNTAFRWAVSKKHLALKETSATKKNDELQEDELSQIHGGNIGSQSSGAGAGKVGPGM
jgi:hypothetical protein